MNVANLTPPVGSAGSVTSVGAATGNGDAGMGQLFSLQMLQTFETMLDSKGVVASPAGLSEEDQKLLDELMALIAQLLAAGQQGNAELNEQVGEKAAAVEQLLGKVFGQGMELASQAGVDLKQLLSKLSQKEASADEMDKVAALLEALKNQKAMKAKRSMARCRCAPRRFPI